MSLLTVQFNKHNQPEFFKELTARVNQYFKQDQRSKYANSNMVFKTVFMLALYFVPLILMLSGVVTAPWLIIVCWAIMGVGLAGVGLSVMHDANHGAYSRNKRVNQALGFTLNFLGGFHTNWKIQHNVLHHTYTNIYGMDEDVSKNILRLSPDQKPNSIYRFQAFYAPLLYGFLTIFWLVAKDYTQLIRYRKKGLLEGQGVTFKSAMAQILVHKTWYLLLILILPMVLLPLFWWQTLLCFLMMHFIGGLSLGLIFEAAHVNEETKFCVADETGSVENSWAIHQMHTTANFARNSGFFSWFIGGLNYQIEHHLFPHICHIHYPKISLIVKQTAAEYNVPYYEHRTFFGALKSHFKLLNKLGTDY